MTVDCFTTMLDQPAPKARLHDTICLLRERCIRSTVVKFGALLKAISPDRDIIVRECFERREIAAKVRP